MQTQDTSKKLEAFTEAMLAEAVEESQCIFHELSEKKDELVAKAEAEIAAEVEKYTKTKVKEIYAREGCRVNSRMTENKRTLLQYREDCAFETNAAVRDRIAGFTESEGYLPHLKMLLRKAVDVFGYGFAAEVQLRPQDMHFADELVQTVSGVSLAFKEGHFELGGLCLYCPAKGKRVDLTFDGALNDLMDHFAEITGIRVDE